MEKFLVFVAVGLAAQAVDGSLGMAYGVTSNTLLVTTGVSVAVASASVHFAEVGTTLVSGLSHWRFGNVDWSVVLRLAVPGGVGAFLGATVLSSVSTGAAEPWVAGLLFLLGAYIVARFVFLRPVAPRDGRQPKAWLLAPLGLTGGFIDATGGGGWGPVTTPTLICSGTLDPRKVIGSVSTSEFVVAVSASLGFLVGLADEAIDWRIVGGLLAGGVLAAPFAAYLVRHLSLPVLGALVGSLILVTNYRTILRAQDVESAPAYVPIAVAVAVVVLVAVARVRGRLTDADAETDEEPATV